MYVNEKGRTGTTKEASIFLTARNLFAATICSPLEFLLMHSLNSVGSWDVNSVMQTWLEAGNFNQASLINGNFTHVGIACACDSFDEVLCGFIFTHTYIGN